MGLLALLATSATLASYCSPSGDVCYGVFARGRTVSLRITTAAHYFPRYTLCVKAPGAARRCASFPIFRGSGGTWTSAVRHARQFPVPGPGTYRVTWMLDGKPLGPTLRFRLPLR